MKNTRQKYGDKATYSVPTEIEHKYRDTMKNEWKQKTHKDCGELNRTDKKTQYSRRDYS